MNQRFFNYSQKAPDIYKDTIDDNLKRFDQSHDGATYTSFVSAFLYAVIGIFYTILNETEVGSSNKKSYESWLNGLSIFVPLASTFIVLICKKVNMETEKKVKSLIQEGVQSGFFDTPPLLSGKTDEDKNEQGDNVCFDATCYRILRR